MPPISGDWTTYFLKQSSQNQLKNFDNRFLALIMFINWQTFLYEWSKGNS